MQRLTLAACLLSFSQLLSNVCYPFLNVSSQRHHQHPWWAQLWPAVGPFWSQPYPTRGQLLASSQRGCNPPPNLATKSNAVCLLILQRQWEEYFYRCQGDDLYALRGGRCSQRPNEADLPAHACCRRRQKVCFSGGVLEEPLSPSPPAPQEAKGH